MARHEPSPNPGRQAGDAYQIIGSPEEDKYFEAFLKNRGRYLATAFLKRKQYVEFGPYIYHAPILAKKLARMRFVHVVRNPYGVIRSAMRRGWYQPDEDPPRKWRIVPREDDPFFGEWSEWGQFEKCTWFWHANNKFCADLIEQLSPGRTKMLRFEDLIDLNSGAWYELFRWLGAIPPDEGEILSVLSEKMNRQDRGSFPEATEWDPHMIETAERIAGETANRFGYKFGVAE